MRPADGFSDADAMELGGKWKKMPVGDSVHGCGKMTAIIAGCILVLLAMLSSVVYVMQPAEAVSVGPVATPTSASPVLAQAPSMPLQTSFPTAASKESTGKSQPVLKLDSTIAHETPSPQAQLDSEQGLAQQALPSPSPSLDSISLAAAETSADGRPELLLIRD